MRADFRERAKNSVGGSGAEAMVAQIDDLQSRLAVLALTPTQVLDEEERASDWLKKKAFKRVWHDGPHAKTHAMLNPPRRVLYDRALRGHWSKFPVDPSTYLPLFEQFAREARRSHWSDTALLASSVEAVVDEALRRVRCPARQLALHRCALTVIIEAMDHVDDSGADMARTFNVIERRYVEFVETELTDVVLRDMLELFVWEDYGLSEEIEPFLRSLGADRAEAAVRELDRVVTELRRHELNYQVECACRARATVLASLTTMRESEGVELDEDE